jgi:hypothetical protein
MCARVARHPAEWSNGMPLSIDHGMPNKLPQTFARRARHSSKAIITAIVLTLAALFAIAITAHDKASVTVKTLSPVTNLPILDGSVLMPVVNRQPGNQRLGSHEASH